MPRMTGPAPPEDWGGEPNEPGADEVDDEPIVPEGLGAIGQLAAGVIVVALLLAALIFGSAFLRRLFG
jgi:hypothetical protein